ncbi:MAG: hypothetical protein ACLQVD_20800 [Capsulimonadaceae bacterium]
MPIQSRYFHGAFVALVSIVCCVLPAGASPIALATNLTGPPQSRPAGGDWQPMHILQRLSAGDEIRCGAGQNVTILILSTGVRFEVAAGHDAHVGQTAIAGAVATGPMGGASIQVAKAMTGLDTEPFIARPTISHQRLVKSSPGIMAAGTRSFDLPPLDGDIAFYTFTLFDKHDNVVWSVRTADQHVDCPADLPDFTLRRPYVWTESGFGPSGKPVPATRWGIITFLSTDDAASLDAQVKALNADLAASPQDNTPLLMQAELYRQYGVLEGTLEKLEDNRLHGIPGIDQAQHDTYAEVSPYALMLSLPPTPVPQ